MIQSAAPGRRQLSVRRDPRPAPAARASAERAQCCRAIVGLKRLAFAWLTEHGNDILDAQWDDPVDPTRELMLVRSFIPDFDEFIASVGWFLCTAKMTPEKPR